MGEAFGPNAPYIIIPVLVVGGLFLLLWLTEPRADEAGGEPLAIGNARLPVLLLWWAQHEDRPAWLHRLARRYAPVRLAPPAADPELLSSRRFRRPSQTDQTDRQTDPVSPLHNAASRVQLDRTRTSVIELLVLADWNVGQIRGVLKGDSGAIGAEVAAARERLGLAAPPQRMLPVQDNGGPKREIPWEEPASS